MREWLSKIDDKITEIKNLEDEMMLFKKVMNNDNLEITKSPTNNFTYVYHSIFFNKILTFLIHLAESNKLLVSIKLLVQDSDFDLLDLSQLVDFPTKSFVDKNLIEL